MPIDKWLSPARPGGGAVVHADRSGDYIMCTSKLCRTAEQKLWFYFMIHVKYKTVTRKHNFHIYTGLYFYLYKGSLFMFGTG